MLGNQEELWIWILGRAEQALPADGEDTAAEEAGVGSAAQHSYKWRAASEPIEVSHRNVDFRYHEEYAAAVITEG